MVRFFTTARVCIALALSLSFVTLAGCAREPHENVMAHAEALVREAHWEQAEPVLKARLLDAPEDTAAHFYLGRCYLNAPSPVLAVAEGEFYVCLTLFQKQGRKSPIAQYTDTYFEMRCYLEIAKVHLRSLQFAVREHADPRLIGAILDRCRIAAAEARRVDPNAAEVQELERLLRTAVPRVPMYPPPPVETREHAAT